jgi:hypothetical protein
MNVYHVIGFSPRRRPAGLAKDEQRKAKTRELSIPTSRYIFFAKIIHDVAGSSGELCVNKRHQPAHPTVWDAGNLVRNEDA